MHIFQNLSPGLVESEMAAGLIDKYPYIKSEDIAKGVTYIISQPAGVNVGVNVLLVCS